MDAQLTQAGTTASVHGLQNLVAFGLHTGSLCTELACMYGLSLIPNGRNWNGTGTEPEQNLIPNEWNHNGTGTEFNSK